MAITVYTASRTTIQLEERPLAAPGGEGSVHRVMYSSTYPNHCAKIYHVQKRNLARKQKIEFMVKNKPPMLSTANYIICFPLEMIYDYRKNFIGFIMPLAFQESEKLYELTTTKIAPRLNLYWSKFERTTKSGIEKRLKVCVNIARAIHDIHQTKKYVIVDYKPQNILITKEGKISITDVDSFQISYNSSVLHYSEVSTPEYAPPESIRINPSKTFIPESWDRFSLAVSFYEILFGIHPYTSTCDGQYGNVTTIGEKIQKGLFVHGSKKIYLTVVPQIHNNFLNLPLSVRSLFIKAFEDGHTNPDNRPTAESWGQTIYQELTANSDIKANTTAVPQKKNVSTSIQQSYSSAPATVTVKTTTQRNAAGTITIKENYMIWKICTFILAAATFGFYIKSSSNDTELNNLKSKVLSYESRNTNLQSQVDQLQNSQVYTESNYNSRITELENYIDAIGQKYPITLNDITFNNITNEWEVLNSETHDFAKLNIQYIQPVINFNSNLRNENSLTINYKILDPNGKLLTGTNSPNGYTWYKDISVAGYFSEDNTETIGGFGVNCPYNCLTGRYSVEIWCNGFLLGESYFNINNY